MIILQRGFLLREFFDKGLQTFHGIPVEGEAEKGIPAHSLDDIVMAFDLEKRLFELLHIEKRGSLTVK